MTLTEFLLARIAEAEAAAKHVEKVTVSWRRRWHQDGVGAEAVEVTPAEPAHPFNPARVLADCKAKRRIVERASRSVVTVTSQRPSAFGNLSFSEGRYYADDGRDVTDEFAAWHAVDGEPEDPTTLRILAAVYADHPDYRAEWKP